MTSKTARLAVLIDGDNVAPDAMDGLFATVATLGEAMVRRVYGSSQLSSGKWLEASNRHALSLGRRHLHAKGHNASDIELVIGAMDLLAENSVDGFCLVSSDGDFTPLAIRLREAGKMVYGCGRSAPEAFRNACHEFFQIELAKTPFGPGNVVPFNRAGMAHVIACINRISEEHKGKDGWTELAVVGTMLRQEIPGFEKKHHGVKTLKQLVLKAGCYEIREGEPGGASLRLRSGKKSAERAK